MFIIRRINQTHLVQCRLPSKYDRGTLRHVKNRRHERERTRVANPSRRIPISITMIKSSQTFVKIQIIPPLFTTLKDYLNCDRSIRTAMVVILPNLFAAKIALWRLKRKLPHMSDFVGCDFCYKLPRRNVCLFRIYQNSARPAGDEPPILSLCLVYRPINTSEMPTSIAPGHN